MIMIVSPQGEIQCLYAEDLDLDSFGPLSIQRGSHVEPDELGRWWADLSSVNGPTLGPYRLRSDALDAERVWLEEFLTRSAQSIVS